jgi:hypothetical protein
VARKDLDDQPAAARAERDHHEPAIVPAPLLVHEAAPGQVGDDHRGVAVAAQQLGAEIALAERPVVQQRLQRAELPDRQPRRRHHVPRARSDRLAGPHQLDVGVERHRLHRGAPIASGHRSNLKGF